MVNKAKFYFSRSAVIFAIFCIFTILIKFVDVQAIGCCGTSVGFAELNGKFFNLFPYNRTFYVISEILGYVALLVVLSLAVTGLVQLIQRKKLKNVDWTLLCFGFICVVTLVFYLVFNYLIVVNHRPVLTDGVCEVSYPSSHTLLSVVIFLCSAKYFSNNNKKWFQRVCYILVILTIVYRLFSGVHWFTDIFGGIVLGLSVVYFYNGLILCKSVKNDSKNH